MKKIKIIYVFCYLLILVKDSDLSTIEDVEYRRFRPLRPFLPLTPILFPHTNEESESDPVVTVSNARIRGVNANDGDYSMFLGVKFGAINSSNPFGIASPVELEGDIDATTEGPVCPQQSEYTLEVTGSIDCLHLNIFVPNPVSATSNRTVMMYIYGGSFQYGDNNRYSLGPKFFMDRDVILVTINYRLGPYGFINLNTPEVPGNQGLKDQLLAMRWIKSNIEYFGGNPDGMTLFGQSAGAASIDYHLFTDQELLFDKVILQSATSLVETVAPKQPNVNAIFNICEHLGYNALDFNDAVAFLASVSELSVIQAALDINVEFRPTLEQEFENIERIVKNHTIFVDSPKIKDVSIIVGYTNGEVDTKYINIDNITDAIIENMLLDCFKFDSNRLKEMSKLIRKFYIGENDNIADTKFKVSDMDSDLKYVVAGHRSIEIYEKYDAKAIYEYVFNYVGQRNNVRYRDNITEGRALHADELGYLFDQSYDKEEITDEDGLMLDRMITMWVNFAKYGDPTPSQTELLPTKWLPRSENSYYYVIDSEMYLDTSIYNSRMAFWELFYLYNEYYQNAYALFRN